MGLDMHAFTFKEHHGEIPDNCDEKPEEIFYWRKHPNLHGWMEKVYREKYGGTDEFNQIAIHLDRELIEKLEKDVCSNSLPTTVGFFFGMSDDTYKELDLNFIQKAKERIEKGEYVYYWSWW